MASEGAAVATLAPGIEVGPGRPLAFIAGPCVIESEAHVLRMAEILARVSNELHVPLVFKASFDKANRSSLQSYRGPGLEAGLAAGPACRCSRTCTRRRRR